MPSRVRKSVIVGAGVSAVGLSLAAWICGSSSARASVESVAASAPGSGAFPKYDHVFLVISENHNFNQIIGNKNAPIINALASKYGLAGKYTGVSDPSEPNYVAMLGGSDFGISSDDPYFFPGQTVDAPNLLSQLEAAGKTWRAYFQDLPYAGYRGYCFPGKCNGIPDSDTQYVAKHNGIVNFKNMQDEAHFAKQVPLDQLKADLSSDDVPNFGYVVADECNDMHGAPPWCVDSGNPGDVGDNWLVAQGDRFIGDTVSLITSSRMWASGTNAIVLTWDEGDTATDPVPTIVVANHGVRGVQDFTPYSHYSLLASLEKTFGLGCLQNSCAANVMTPLFQVIGSNDVPALPPPVTPAPNGDDSVSKAGRGVAGSRVMTRGSSWEVVPSPTIGTLDHSLASVSAGSDDDAWAVGTFYPPSGDGTVLNTLGLHFDGTRWTAYPLPNVGANLNALLGVSVLPSREAWAVGYYVDAHYRQRTLIEHYDGKDWDVLPSPSPGERQNVLYGVVALSEHDVWAVGARQDGTGTWHTLAEHFDGDAWQVVATADPGATGNLLYAVAATGGAVYATGQQAGTAFPGLSLVERWDGGKWSVVATPVDRGGTDITLGITASGPLLNVVGDRESSKAPYTSLVIAGTASDLDRASTPNVGVGENDLFGAATAADGSTWAVGWAIDPSSGSHVTLAEHGVSGHWALSSTPNPNASAGDDGLSSVAAIPGGGLWAVGVTTNAAGNLGTLIVHHP